VGRQPKEIKIVMAARQEAALAVRLYNDPGASRSLEGFIVHMNLAWLYLIQAVFTRDDVDFRYRDPKKPSRLVYINDGSTPRGKGEVKRWELSRCLSEHWPDPNHPVRTNIDFFIALRNRIEHRHLASDQSLELVISGKAQALLFNFEEEVVGQFGSSWSLANVLRFPVFIGTFSEEGQATLLKLQKKLPAELRRFIVEYDAGLSEETRQDQRFEFRPRVVLEKGVRGPYALAVQFTRWDDMTDEEKTATEQLGKRGQAVIVHKEKPVVAANLKRPQEVVAAVQAGIPFVFNMSHATSSWKRAKIRPPAKDPHPEHTVEQYCVYDRLSRGYGYTDAWIKRLIDKCGSEGGFEEMTGRKPAPK
jgi:hypothetical protein